MINEIKNAYDIEKISETYEGDVEITDLKDDLGTKGHVLVVRGDKAYADKLEDKSLANPKFWLYENLINSERIQEALKEFPNSSLFDGVGFSALEALGFHSKKLGRRAIVVMAHEMLPDSEVFERYDILVIHGDLPAEQGYVKKQREFLKERKKTVPLKKTIPLHQALYGAQALAPVGNKVIKKLEELCIKPDVTSWCIASGSNLYGIGHKIKQRFPDCETLVVEPYTNITINPNLNLKNSAEIKKFALNCLENCSLEKWDKSYSGIFPLHVRSANKYLLLLWESTGDIGFDKIVNISTEDVLETKEQLKEINLDYDWTKTTALTLNPVIELARQGKNVLVMAYGKHREHKFRDIIVNGK